MIHSCLVCDKIMCVKDKVVSVCACVEVACVAKFQS